MDQEEQEEEIPYHVPLTYRVGQLVVVKELVARAHAWHGEHENEKLTCGTIIIDGFYFYMRARLGVRHKVVQEHPLYGFLCSAPGYGYVPLWYPSCALEPCREEFIIEVTSIQGG